MKSPLFFGCVVSCLGLSGVNHALSAADSDTGCQSAVDALVEQLEVRPGDSLGLFRESLETNPACRRALFLTAIELIGEEPGLLGRLIAVARSEFPEDDALFAEAAISFAPERSEEIRSAFLTAPVVESESADPPVMAASGIPADLPHPEEAAKMDEEIREAISRVAARASGKPWPEQEVSGDPVLFKKPDEVRIPRESRGAEEGSLYNSLPIDRHDERRIAPGAVRLDDDWRRNESLRLDESKFTRPDLAEALPDGKAVSLPLEAKVKAMAPAGAVGLPRPPALPRSSVYYIPPAAGSYESTIDLERDETPRPPLIIRPQALSPTSPERVR